MPLSNHLNPFYGGLYGGRSMADDLRENPRPPNPTVHAHFHEHGGVRHAHRHAHTEKDFEHAHSKRTDEGALKPWGPR